MKNEKDDEITKIEETGKADGESESMEKKAEIAEDISIPRIYQPQELSLGDRLQKMYHMIRKSMRSENSAAHTIEAVGISISLGPGQYKTAAVLLKCAYEQVKSAEIKSTMSEMYSLITGTPLEIKS